MGDSLWRSRLSVARLGCPVSESGIRNIEVCEQCEHYQDWKQIVECEWWFRWSPEKGIETWSEANWLWLQDIYCMFLTLPLVTCPYYLENMMAREM